MLPKNNSSSISKPELIGLISQCPKKLQNALSFFLLAEIENERNIIEKLLELQLSDESDIVKHLHVPEVYQFFSISRKVKRQLHKLKGLIRFRELEGGYLYASFTSDFNLLRPLALHFSQRLNTEKIIIHDLQRNRAIYAEKGELYGLEFTSALPSTTDKELLFYKLWKNYFHTIGIEQRKNKQLQSQNIPKKYQRWVCEFQENINLTLEFSDLQ